MTDEELIGVPLIAHVALRLPNGVKADPDDVFEINAADLALGIRPAQWLRSGAASVWDGSASASEFAAPVEPLAEPAPAKAKAKGKGAEAWESDGVVTGG